MSEHTSFYLQSSHCMLQPVVQIPNISLYVVSLRLNSTTNEDLSAIESNAIGSVPHTLYSKDDAVDLGSHQKNATVDVDQDSDDEGDASSSSSSGDDSSDDSDEDEDDGLSEYEPFRRRKIKKNLARLAELGLLTNADASAGRSGSSSIRSSFTNSKQSSGEAIHNQPNATSRPRASSNKRSILKEEDALFKPLKGFSQSVVGNYQALISIKGTPYSLGSYKLQSDAALAYDKAAMVFRGPTWSKINFATEQDHRALRAVELNTTGLCVDLEDVLVQISSNVNDAAGEKKGTGSVRAKANAKSSASKANAGKKTAQNASKRKRNTSLDDEPPIVAAKRPKRSTSSKKSSATSAEDDTTTSNRNANNASAMNHTMYSITKRALAAIESNVNEIVSKICSSESASLVDPRVAMMLLKGK